MIEPLTAQDRARLEGKRVVASVSGGKDSAAVTRECASIDEVVQWSKTASGGKNLALFQPGPPDEGCMRWGVCEAASPEREEGESGA